MKDYGLSEKDALKNILSAVNRGRSAIILDKDVDNPNNFDAIQNFLKNPAIDMRYVLLYGEKAAEEALKEKDQLEAFKNSPEYQAQFLRRFQNNTLQSIKDVHSRIAQINQELGGGGKTNEKALLDEAEKLLGKRLTREELQQTELQLKGTYDYFTSAK